MDHSNPELTYHPDFLESEEADALQAQLETGLAWEQHRVKLFGKEVDCPRLSAWYGDPGALYGYSGVDYHPREWTPELSTLRKKVQALSDTDFNSVLPNRYRDGTDSMGWHADDERELGPNPIIASVSLGARRKLRFRLRANHRVTREIWLDRGSLLIMHGSVQDLWHHALPKTKRVGEERINLTFRMVYPK